MLISCPAKFWVSFLFGILLSATGFAQTLAPGDIVITGLNSTDPDEFAFSPLVDLSAGTQIQFTDNGWLAYGGFRATEGVATYTVPAGGIPKGRIVSYSITNHPNFTATAQFLLAAEGDQLLVYQGSASNPRFIAGLTTRGPWSTTATTSNNSALPTGLQEGTTAVSLSWSNAYISQVALRRGLTAAVRTAFNTASKWTGNNTGRQTWPTSDLILEGLVRDADEIQALQELYTGTNGSAWMQRANWPTAMPWAASLSNVDFAT